MTSSTAKRGVLPIAKPVKPEKAPSRLSRKAPMERKPSKLKRGPVGHASPEQRAKAKTQGCRITAYHYQDAQVDPAHVTPRGIGGCDHEDCVIGLRRDLHGSYDEGNLDILPYLTLEEQAHAVSHLGILGALKRTTGETYVPQPEGDQP